MRLGAAPGELEHGARCVDADDGDAGERGRHRNPARADSQLEHGAVALHREVDVERDVLEHRPAPGAVRRPEPVVGGGHGLYTTRPSWTWTLWSRRRRRASRAQ